MSVLEIGGRRFAVGLDWTVGTGSAAVGRAAAAAGRPWAVYVGGQAGLASAAGDPAGTAALAGALRKLVAEASWMALAGGAEGPWAVVRQVNGRLLPDGDRVYARLDEALEAFGQARDRAGALLASPGLLPEDPDVRVLDHEALAATEGLAAVQAAPRSVGAGGRGRTAALAGFLLLASGGSLWMYWPWVAGFWKEEPREAPPVPTVGTATDSDAFLGGCAAALERVLLHLGGWRRRDPVCYARFRHGEIAGVHPGLRGRPALLAAWKLMPGLDAQAHRRLAEAALRAGSGWDVWQVGGDTAWAVAALAPAVRKFQAPPPYRAFRASVDRAFGLRGLSVAHGAAPSRPEGDAAVTVTGRLRMDELRAIASEVPGLEAVKASTGENGLELVARKERAEVVPEPEFRRLQRGIGS